MDCASVHTETTPSLLEFAANMHLQPFTHGMRGPTWVNAQGFVGALDIFLGPHASSEVGVVRVVSEFVFPSKKKIRIRRHNCQNLANYHASKFVTRPPTKRPTTIKDCKFKAALQEQGAGDDGKHNPMKNTIPTPVL